MKAITQFLVGALILIPLSASAAAHVEVKIAALKHFSPSDQKRLESAARLLENVLSSDAFEQRVLDFSFEGQKRFANNNGLSNAEIYEVITRQPVVLDLEIYKSWRHNVVGYTNPGTTHIWLNRYWFARFSEAEIAANLAHEWMHKIGFDHDFYRTARRPYSVPYAVGNLVEELGQD